MVRLRLPYPDADAFVEKFAPNVTRGGIFLASREPRPVGSTVRFELNLSSGQLVLAGEGRVTWVKQYDPSAPHRAYGMGVQFTLLDETSRALVARMAARRDPSRRPTASVAVGSGPTLSARSRGERTTELDEPIEDDAVRRALDRARVLSARIDDLDGLLLRDTEAPATLADALANLPRLIAGPRRSATMRRTDEPTRTAGMGSGTTAPQAERDMDDDDLDAEPAESTERRTAPRSAVELSAATRVS